MIALALSVVLIGDSISFGYSSEPFGPPFAVLLPYEVVNLAIPGATFREWGLSDSDINLYPTVPPHLPADVATILLGTNDSRRKTPTPIEPPEYAERMAEMVDNLLEDGARRVVVMSAPRNFATTDPAIHNRLQAYREVTLDLCEPPGDRIECGPDVWQLLGPEHFAPNNVHPTGEGHAIIAEELAIVIPEASAPIAALLVLAFLRRRVVH